MFQINSCIVFATDQKAAKSSALLLDDFKLLFHQNMNDSPGEDDFGMSPESEVEKKITSNNTNFAFLHSGAFTGKS